MTTGLVAGSDAVGVRAGTNAAAPAKAGAAPKADAGSTPATSASATLIAGATTPGTNAHATATTTRPRRAARFNEMLGDATYHADTQAATVRRRPPARHAKFRPTAPDIVAFTALVLVVFESMAGILPDEPTVWIFTPLRGVLLLGLVAGLLASTSIRTWSTPLDLPIALLILAAIPPAVLIAGDFAPWRWLVTYLAAYYLAVAVSRRLADDWASFGLLGLAGVGIAGIIAVRQFAAQMPTGLCRNPLTGSSTCEDPSTLVRVVGTFDNPNTLAAFLLLALPLAASFAFAARRAAAQVIAWSTVAVGVLAVVFTWSRAPIVALAVGAAVYWLLRTPTTPRIRLGAIAAGAGLALFALVAVVAPGASGVRSDVWRTAAALALQQPLGVGLQRGGEVIQANIDGTDEAFNHAHNLWINLWLETGWLGLLAAIAITVIAAIVVVDRARRGWVLAPAIGASLAAFACASLVDHAANTTRVALALAVVLGVLMAAHGPPDYRRMLVTAGLATPADEEDAELADPAPEAAARPARGGGGGAAAAPAPTSAPRPGVAVNAAASPRTPDGVLDLPFMQALDPARSRARERDALSPRRSARRRAETSPARAGRAAPWPASADTNSGAGEGVGAAAGGATAGAGVGAGRGAAPTLLDE